jgi:hypothetical protein
MFVQLALLAAQMWLGEITRQRPKRTSFENFSKDNAPSEVRPIVFLAGTEEVTPQRIYFGDYLQRAVERDSHWTDYLWAGALAGLLDFITVAYRSYAAEVFPICFGPDTHVEAIKIQDRLVFQAVVGSDNAGGGFLIDDPQAWGGDQPPGEGGQYAWCDLTRGNYTDPTNAYLESLLATAPNKTPSLGGISTLVVRGPSGFPESGYFHAGGVGSVPRFKEWKITARRQPNNLLTGFHKIGRHANPIEVYYEHTVSQEYGARVPISEINIPSWQAVAETLYDEENGWTGKIEDPTSPLEVCKNIEQQVDMVMDPSPSLGLTARLIRRDYSIPSLRILNRDNVSKDTRIEYSPGSYEDTTNQTIVAFEDQNSNFASRPAIYIDPANQRIQGGRIVPNRQQYNGIADYDGANEKATRDGRVGAIPRAPLTLNCFPSFGKLTYRGEPIRFQWTNPTFEKVMRITSVTPGTARSPDYRLVMIEDQFATGFRVSGSPIGSGHVDPGTALDTAPPSAAWDTVALPPDGLQVVIVIGNGGALETSISGAIIFDAYAPGGQYARVWVTEPGGTQTLSPLHLPPDENNKQIFSWSALAEGPYEFCIQTFSTHSATNGTKICAAIEVVFSESGVGALTINGITVTQNGAIMTQT